MVCVAGEATAYGRVQAARMLERVRPARSLQMALGALWLLDGALQLQPFMFTRGFATQIIEPNAAGQPGAIGAPIVWMAHQIGPHIVLFNLLAATIQVLIGLGLMWRRTVKAALIVSFAWMFGVWWFGEGLGMLFTGAASPLAGAPGAVLLYGVLGAILWPVGQPGAKRPDWAGGLLGPVGGVEGSVGGLLGPRGARIAWAALWTILAGLWLAPANRGAGATAATIAAAPNGSSWLASVQHAAASAVAGGGTAIAIALATLSAAIAIAVLLEWHARPFLLLACLISLAYWVLGQGLGGILTGSATDPNTGPLFVLLAVAISALPSSLAGATAPARSVSSWRGASHSLAWPR